MNIRIRSARSATAMLLLLVTGSAVAADGSESADRFRLQLGAFLSDFDTRVVLKGPNGGDRVDLENNLGLDSRQASFRGEFSWQFADRHSVSIGYYQFDRKSKGRAQRSFVIDTPQESIEFDVGVRVRTEFGWRLVPIFYSYRFLERDRFSASASIGVHWLNPSVSYEAAATVNGISVESASASEGVSAPLPVLGIEAEYLLTPKWRVGARAQYFSLDYEEYSGGLTDVRLVTEYSFENGFGVGLGYTWFESDASRDRGRYSYGVDHSYDGLEAFLGLRF